MNTINLKAILRDFEGEAFQTEDKDGTKRPMTVKDALLGAIRTPLRTDENLDFQAKYEIGLAGSCIVKGLPLTAEQISMLKERCAKIFSPALVFDLVSHIDPAQAEQTPAKASPAPRKKR